MKLAYINLGEQSFPVMFNYNALMEFEKLTGKVASAALIDDGVTGKMNLTYCALKEGHRIALRDNQPTPWNEFPKNVNDVTELISSPREMVKINDMIVDAFVDREELAKLEADALGTEQAEKKTTPKPKRRIGKRAKKSRSVGSA